MATHAHAHPGLLHRLLVGLRGRGAAHADSGPATPPQQGARPESPVGRELTQDYLRAARGGWLV